MQWKGHYLDSLVITTAFVDFSLFLRAAKSFEIVALCKQLYTTDVADGV